LVKRPLREGAPHGFVVRDGDLAVAAALLNPVVRTGCPPRFIDATGRGVRAGPAGAAPAASGSVGQFSWISIRRGVVRLDEQAGTPRQPAEGRDRAVALEHLRLDQVVTVPASINQLPWDSSGWGCGRASPDRSRVLYGPLLEFGK